jgi:hypothetical protein
MVDEGEDEDIYNGVDTIEETSAVKKAAAAARAERYASRHKGEPLVQLNPSKRLKFDSSPDTKLQKNTKAPVIEDTRPVKRLKKNETEDPPKVLLNAEEE